jgi:hypothetical protein
MAPNDDKNDNTNIWDALFIRSASFALTPETIRAWTTIALAIALISLILWVPLSLALLGRLGLDAFWLPNPQYQEATRNFFLAFAAVFGAPFLIWRTWVAHQQARAAIEQARVALENHFTGIFSKSVELLGLLREMKTVGVDGASMARSIPNIESRLGALYSLERLLGESEKDQRAILETLCAYVRENSPLQIPEDDEQRKRLFRGDINPAPTRRSDVQAAITIIGRRPGKVQSRAEGEDWRLDFRDTNMAGYDFSKLNFDRSDFTGSFLNSAKFSEASFVNSIFENSVLCSTRMNRTCFRLSHFKHCQIKNAEIDNTDFSVTKIEDTDLREANVISFNIAGADLESAFGSYLQYVVDDIKTNGAKHSLNMSEIVKTVQLFQKGTHDRRTTVSQAVQDAIRLMTADTSAPTISSTDQISS